MTLGSAVRRLRGAATLRPLLMDGSRLYASALYPKDPILRWVRTVRQVTSCFGLVSPGRARVLWLRWKLGPVTGSCRQQKRSDARRLQDPIDGIRDCCATDNSGGRRGDLAAKIYNAVDTEVPAAANTVAISASANDRKHPTTAGSNCDPLASVRRRTASS